MKKRLSEINVILKARNYVDIDYQNGFLAERAMLLMLDKSLPTNF